jgi:hypothetical protein
MRCVRRNNGNAARFHLALFVSDGDRRAAFECESDFDIRMFMQRRTLPGLGLDDVGREGRALSFADKLIGHSNKWQLLEIDEAHAAICTRTRVCRDTFRGNLFTLALATCAGAFRRASCVADMSRDDR